MHTHAGCTLLNPVTLTFDLLISGSVHAEPLPYSICGQSLVLIAQAVFLSERRHTDTHTVTDTTDHPSHASAIVSVRNYRLLVLHVRHRKELVQIGGV